MQHRTIPTDGAVVYWRTGDSDARLVRDALGVHCPPDEAPAALLRRAMTAEYADAQTLIRPLAGAGGCAAVREDRGASANTYRTTVAVSIDSAGVVEVDPVDEYDRVRRAIEQAAQVFPSRRVSMGLVHATQAMLGVSVRPAGGVYYLPPAAVPQFRDIAERVEAAAIRSGETSVYLLRTPTDAETARAIVDALTADSEAAAARIEAEIAAGVGPKAAATREREAVALLDRLHAYEDMLGQHLDRTREIIERAKTAAATAALVSASDNGGLYV